MGYIVLLLANQIRDIFRVNDKLVYLFQKNNISSSSYMTNLSNVTAFLRHLDVMILVFDIPAAYKLVNFEKNLGKNCKVLQNFICVLLCPSD